MSHTEIMLLDSFLRDAWWLLGDWPMSRALEVSQYWPKGRRYIRSEYELA